MSSSDPFSQDPYRSPQISTPAFQTTADSSIVQLSGTRIGLRLVYWGIVLILVAVVVLILGIVAGAAIGGVGWAVGAGLAALFLTFAVIIGALMMFVGQCLCLTVPQATGAKGLIITCVGLQLLNVMVGIGVGVAVAAFGIDEEDPVSAVIQFVSGILVIVGFFCFLVFIKKVAQFIDRGDLSRDAGKVIGVFASMIGLYMLMIAMVIVAAMGGATAVAIIGGIMGVVMFLLGLVGFFMYTKLLRDTAAAIGERIATPSAT